MTTHTIILTQTSSSEASRTYTDHRTVADAIESVCCVFERDLKERHSEKKELSYDIKELHTFIDRLADISALVYDPKTKSYIPCNRDWIKKKCFQHLYKLSNGNK
eukprot:jgi/Ulvmu1/5423/UM022_0218.1